MLIQEFKSNQNSLAIKNPKIASEWHPTKNFDLTPNDITLYSNKKVWWLCKNKGHEWEARVYSRSRGSGCPCCNGKKACKDNCLSTTHFHLASEWHSTKNGVITPDDVVYGSHKEVWWECVNGHEWKASIHNRSGGTGCPFCVIYNNRLSLMNPELTAEWHPTKNKNLTPDDVTVHSGKRVWWKCNNGHEWEAKIYSRSDGNKCPYCSSKKICGDNSLATFNPVLTLEWNVVKNGDLTPNDFAKYSRKKVWWICKNGHEWEASITNRSHGNGCSYCSHRTSEIELLVYSEMKYIFPKAEHGYKIDGIECDIYIPEINLAIESDGWYWHKDKLQNDKEKNKKLNDLGIKPIRLRESVSEKKELCLINNNDIIYSYKRFDIKNVIEIISQVAENILKFNINKDFNLKLKQYIEKNALMNQDYFLKIKDRLPYPIFEKSLLFINPNLASEWHPIKNGVLTADKVTQYSDKKVWWMCKKSGHEWEAKVYHRSKGASCPYCSGWYKKYRDVKMNVNEKSEKFMVRD